MFEPIALAEGFYNATVKRSGDYFLIVTSLANNYCLTTFDIGGKLGEYEYEILGNAYTKFDISGETVLIHDGTGHGCVVKYLTLDFAEIF